MIVSCINSGNTGAILMKRFKSFLAESLDYSPVKGDGGIIGAQDYRYIVKMPKIVDGFREYYSDVPDDLDMVIKNYGIENKFPRDSVVVDINTESLARFMEWPEPRLGPHRQDPAKFNLMVKKIGKEGLGNFDPLLFHMRRLSNKKDLLVWVGDGNHRLKAALINKIEKVPVRFSR